MGTNAVKIYDCTSNTVSKEMNMIAVKDQDTVYAVGNQAFELFERTPEDLQIISPMKNGRIQDVLMMEAILHLLMKKVGRFVGTIPVLYFSVPLDMTELERRAYSTIARKGRFRHSRIFFVEKPIADALSIGIPIHRTSGTMIINIGSQCSEVSVIAEGKVLITRQIEYGGQMLSTAIAGSVRQRNGLQISRRTAQRLKFSVPNILDIPKEGYPVEGIDTSTGLPSNELVSARTVAYSIRAVLSEIANELVRLMDRMPPQIRAGIKENGIFLTGGCTNINGLTEYFRGRLDYPVYCSEHHEYETVQGLKQIIDHSELRHWAMIPEKRKNRFEQ